jgi:hypothetical protein
MGHRHCDCGWQATTSNPWTRNPWNCPPHRALGPGESSAARRCSSARIAPRPPYGRSWLAGRCGLSGEPSKANCSTRIPGRLKRSRSAMTSGVIRPRSSGHQRQAAERLLQTAQQSFPRRVLDDQKGPAGQRAASRVDRGSGTMAGTGENPVGKRYHPGAESAPSAVGLWSYGGVRDVIGDADGCGGRRRAGGVVCLWRRGWW